MILLDEQSKEESPHLQPLYAWLSEPETKASLQRCADFAVETLHNDTTLRVPRSIEQRENGFTTWRNEWRDRLGTAIQEEFFRQFPGITRNLSPDSIKNIVIKSVWPQVEAELMTFALEGLARTWVRRHMGDATTIGRPRLETDHWVVPIGIKGYADDLGQVTLDSNGNVIEAASSSRNDMLARIP